MVMITSDVKEMINTQKMILVGTSNKHGVPNVSPRISFYVDKDAIYWYEIFLSINLFKILQKIAW